MNMKVYEVRTPFNSLPFYALLNKWAHCVWNKGFCQRLYPVPTSHMIRKQASLQAMYRRTVCFLTRNLSITSVKGILLFATAAKPALGSTQPPIQWVSEILFPRKKRTTHLHLLPWLRMRGVTSWLPPYVSTAWWLI